MIFSRKNSIVFICLFLFVQTFFAVNNQEIEKTLLQKKVIANGLLFQENMNKALIEIEVLLKEAVQIKDSLSELKLLERKCLYF